MTSQAIQSDKLSHIGLDISSTSEQFLEASQSQNIQVLMSSTTSQFLEASQSQNIQVLMSSTTSQLECQKYNRCGKSNCIHCQTIYQGKKAIEVTTNIKHKELLRTILTVKAEPTDQLNNLLIDLFTYFRTLRRTKYWIDNVKGGLARLHVDHKLTWHPHLDILIETNPEGNIEENTLSKLWENITNNSHYVHVQPVTKTDLSHIKLSTYILKPSFKGIQDQDILMNDYIKAVKGKKKLLRFGKWVNTKNRKDWRNYKQINKLK